MAPASSAPRGASWQQDDCMDDIRWDSVTETACSQAGRRFQQMADTDGASLGAGWQQHGCIDEVELDGEGSADDGLRCSVLIRRSLLCWALGQNRSQSLGNDVHAMHDVGNEPAAQQGLPTSWKLHGSATDHDEGCHVTCCVAAELTLCLMSAMNHTF